MVKNEQHTLEGILPVRKLDWGEESFLQLLLPWVFSDGPSRQETDGSRGSIGTPVTSG